jgi:ribosomal protein S18 acetylase RimI-like enzyme
MNTDEDTSELSVFEDRLAFLGLVRDHLEADEAENSLMLGFLENQAPDSRSGLKLLVYLHRSEKIVGVACMTPLNVIVSRGMIHGATQLVAVLRERHDDPPGLVGPLEAVDQVADAWLAARGCARGAEIDQMIYELRSVTHPTGVAGTMRTMTENDVELVTQWCLGFHLEALPHEPYTLQEAQENARARPAKGWTYIWEVEGTPVAMAALARPTRHGVTINAVYTPPEYRRHGYASALVAKLSEEGLRQGKEFCMLYTDLANPTANAIYRRIGYQPVSRSKRLQLQY